MPHAGFVHLRVHSAYSLAEGAITGKELVSLAAGHGMPAVAMTDSGNLFGALEFAVTASGSGVQPIVGVQLARRRDNPKCMTVPLTAVLSFSVFSSPELSS